MRRWFNGWSLFTVLLVYFVFGPHIWRVLAQAGAGYVKIASTSGLSQIDTSVVNGQAYQYQVTAVDQFGESTPVTSMIAIIPATGIHSVTLSWIASTTIATPAVTYNVYRLTGTIPNQPGAVAVTVN